MISYKGVYIIKSALNKSREVRLIFENVCS
jgi:hypothetical protein